MLKSSYQHTVRSKVRINGIGVHSGDRVNMTIKQAPACSGIIFIRTDIKDRNNIISAKWSNVADTKLCTVIANKEGVSVSTVEHLMSAFANIGLDNAIVEIDNPEVPIMDGSAIYFIKALSKAGLTKQSAKRRAICIKKAVSCVDGDREVFLSPSNITRFSFEIDFDSKAIGKQNYTYTLDEDSYRKDIAKARTFGMLHEVEYLRNIGLARGGSLENAIVIDGDEVMNPEGLRFKDEFVRHKILDAIGDIYMTGMQLIGHYHGIKAGHATNSKILKTLFAQPEAFEIIDYIPDNQVKTPSIYGISQACPIRAMA